MTTLAVKTPTAKDLKEALKSDLCGVGRLTLADESAGDGVPAVGKSGKFRGVLNTGTPVKRWYGTLLFDMGGIELPSTGKSLPLLLNHGMGDTPYSFASTGWPNIGVLETVKLEGRNLVVTGKLLSNETATKVKNDAADGFPWEMSMGVDIKSIERVETGQETEVNGETVTGPVFVVRRAKLREGSIVQQGADPNTSVEMLSRGAAPGQGVHAMDLSNLTIEQLRAQRPDLAPPAAPAAPAAATIEQLKSLPGADADFIVAQLTAKATPDAAMTSLLAQVHEKLAGIEAAHAEKIAGLEKAHGEALAAVNAENERLAAENDVARKAAGLPAAVRKPGQPAPSGLKLAGEPASGGEMFAGCGGTDPEADWKNSEELRAKFGNNKGGFDTFVRQCQRDGADYAVKW